MPSTATTSTSTSSSTSKATSTATATSTSVARERRPTRTRSADTLGLPAALRSEWIKISTVRTYTVLLGLTVLSGLVTSWATGTFVKDEVLFAREVFLYSTVLTSVFASITGILLLTSEAQHGTLTGVLTSQPARWVIVVAKSCVAAAAGLGFGVLGMAAGFGGSLLAGLDVGDTSALPRIIAWSLVFTTASGVLGVGLGMIARNSAAAISGLLVWSLVVENLLREFLNASVARFLPFNAGNGLLSIPATNDTAARKAVQLSSIENAFVFGGFTAVAIAIGTLLLYRRDTN